MTEQSKEDRLRAFAEYDASVSGSVRPEGLDGLDERLTAALTFDYSSGGEGYAKAAQAMADAAVEAFEWACRNVHPTGWQASSAALSAYARMLSIDGPILVQRAEEALYPQYDLHAQLDRWLCEARPWLREQAVAKLDAALPPTAADRVVEHWQMLAGWSDHEILARVREVAASDGSFTSEIAGVVIAKAAAPRARLSRPTGVRDD